MEELLAQLPEAWFDGPVTIAYAVGSGGTAAGVELGVRAVRWRGARPLGFAVCNDAAYFRSAVAAICADARRRVPELPDGPAADVAIDDGSIGPGYAIPTEEGLEVIRRAARLDGVILDPVYTGKAMLGLARRARASGGL